MILRVFPRKTSYTPCDSYAFVGNPPMEAFRPADVDEIHVSVTFTWDLYEGDRLALAWGDLYPQAKVMVGGPAHNAKPGKFIPGMYISNGVTFTTRGCNNNCPFCLVPQREGKLVEIEDFQPGYIVQDNNFIQSSQQHQEKVFTMLARQKRSALFSGGIQSSLVNDWFAEELRKIRVDQLFLAADSHGALKPLENAINKLSFLGKRKLRVYTLVGFQGETIEAAEERLEAVWRLGGLPFAQLYQPADKWIEYSQEWKDLNRKWSRPAAVFSSHKVPVIVEDNQPRLFYF